MYTLLKCKNDYFYVGVTNNIERRFNAHQAGLGARFTKQNKPVTLLYQEAFESKSLAMKREQQLKGWSRAKKAALMTGNMEELRRLSTSHD